MKKSHYAAPDAKIWQGRIDQSIGDTTQRWHQRIQLWDLHLPQPPKLHTGKAIALLGFCSDEGVKRNCGRSGAKDGPLAIRKALCNLPVHFAENATLYDAGNVLCTDTNLEVAQEELGHAVARVLASDCFPIVLGGGHEVAYGHYLGLKAPMAKSKSLSILNIDAHFDLRPFEQGGHSGSSFLQVAQDCKKNNTTFSYFCLGIQQSANSQALFHEAQKLKANFIAAQDMHPATRSINLAKLQNFSEQQNPIYLTICLDAFAAAFAPGVSAPSALGILPNEILPYLDAILKTKKVISLDVAELCPKHDNNDITAKLAAQLIFHCVTQIF